MKKKKKNSRKARRIISEIVLSLLALLFAACLFLPEDYLRLPDGFPFFSAGKETAAPSASLTEAVPPYSGQDYVELNGGRPVFSEEELRASSHVTFSEFDSLGRTGPGSAVVGPETRPTESRGSVGYFRPSGWHTVRYDDLIEDRYLYNRSHVIGYMLCGDNATSENLFTGTRHLNAVSMLQFEMQTVWYIASTGNHVAYRVTPVYEGNNLVCTGVQMEAYSIEDSGKGLCFNVFVYNIQPGVIIDYRSGESRRDPDYIADQADAAPAAEQGPEFDNEVPQSP